MGDDYEEISILFFGSHIVAFGIWRGDKPASANAETKPDWEISYEEMRTEMEQESKSVLEQEITLKTKEEVSEEEQGMTLVSYDIKNAIPVWSLDCDVTMIADYKEQDGEFSKILKWENKWYIPAVTAVGSHASIFLQKEEGAYHVYGIFFDEDEVYAAETMEEIASTITEKVGTDVVSVKTVSVPFYLMNLLYVQKENGEDFILPYEAGKSNVIENIKGESGKVYEAEDFIEDMDRTYDEYTKEEIKEMAAKKTLGGVYPKLKPLSENGSGIGKSIGFILFGCGGVLVAALTILLVRRRRIGR